MISCKKYPNHEIRLKRCEELGVCKYCTSTKHNSSNCKRSLDFPCSNCKTSEISFFEIFFKLFRSFQTVSFYFFRLFRSFI